MASAAERHLRSQAVDRLRAILPGARVIHELNVELGSCRVDLAAVTSNFLYLVEIKSRKDTLDRLPSQCETFAPACHRLAVCFASERWSYEAVRSKAGYGVDLWPEDQPSLWAFHTSHKPPNTSAMLNLLWRDELDAEAVRHRLQPKKRTNRSDLIAMLWRTMTGEEVIAAVCRQLRARHFAEADAPVFELAEAA